MWDIPRLYVSACSNLVQLVPLHPIIMSIVFHHYKELKEYIAEGKHVENKVYTNNKELTMKKEEELYNFIIMINETTADHNLLTHPLHIPLSTIPHVHTERRINFL